MASDIIRSMMYSVMILNIVILEIYYRDIYKDTVNDASIIGSRSDFLKELMSSIDFSNAMIGFGIAFLGATVVYIASKSSQRNDYIVWQLIMWLVEVSFATTILGLALNAMGYLLSLLSSSPSLKLRPKSSFEPKLLTTRVEFQISQYSIDSVGFEYVQNDGAIYNLFSNSIQFTSQRNRTKRWLQIYVLET
uniref:Uncharacterized protein n=1 Tax=Lactuca sativa TaxID=4236 RepID=A0A9R1V1Y4_LACSA|nr:hypothetical protein LSAT_V11C700353310 [Lactuca sativa]